MGASPFGKVVKMIEDMITRITTQMNEEADQKAWCDAEVTKSTEKKEKKTDRLGVLRGRIDAATADVEKLTARVSQLNSEITELREAMVRCCGPDSLFDPCSVRPTCYAPRNIRTSRPL